MKKCFKKVTLLLTGVLLASIIAVMIPENQMTVQAAGYTESGVEGVQRLSMDELRSLYKSIQACEDSIYAKEATFGSGQYAISELKDSSMANALGWINYYRQAAGLRTVSTSAVLNESAAYGALVDAAYGKLDHYPLQAEGMPGEIYAAGAYATAFSNISWSSNYGENSVLRVSIYGQMKDEADFNLTTLGHRRWLLYPYTTTIGIGAANNETGYYTDIRLFGDNVETDNTQKYNYIAWPASGANLRELFGDATPWSVTLSPEVYDTKKLDHVKVVLTQSSNGKKWTFDSNTANANGAYFGVDTNGYGVANCIIFRTASNDRPSYSGSYVVEIQNLTLKSGAQTTLTYCVEFGSCKDGLSIDNTFPCTYYVDYDPAYGMTAYEFIPAVTAEYTFESFGDNDTVAFLYDAEGTKIGDNDDKDDTDYNFKLTEKLIAGQKYRLMVKNYHPFISTFAMKVTRDYQFVIKGQPENASVSENKIVSFTVAADGSDLTYQWQKSTDGGKKWVNSSSSSATTDTLKMTAKLSFNGLLFRCVIKDATGETMTSDAVKLSVAAALAIKEQPADKSVTAGETVAFTVKADGSNLTYQWQKSTDGGVKWANSTATSAKTATFKLVTKISFNGMKLRCKVTDGNGVSKYSSVATLLVKAAEVPLTITSQPMNESVKVGEEATFTAAASGNGLTYQWQKSSNNGGSWINSGSTGAKTATLKMTAKISFNGLMFRCKITDNTGKSVYTDAVVLSVGKGLEITSQPTDISVKTGTATTFTVAANGDNMTYQWQKSTDGGAYWTNSGSTGAKTAAVSLTAKLSFNNMKFRCIIKDGNGNTVISDVVTLTVSAK